MNEIIPFQYNNNSIRVIEDENTGEVLWVAKDICEVLELSDVNKAVSKLDDDEKLIRKFFVSGQNRDMICINESGLYTLILRSNKQEAKKLKKWVTSEVLPTIRKTGKYSLTDMKTNSYEENFYKNKYLELLERENELLRDIAYSNSILSIKPNKLGTKFSNSEIQTLSNLYNQGYSTRQIANIINRSSSGVHNFIKRLKKDIKC